MSAQAEDHGTMEIDTPPHVDVGLPSAAADLVGDDVAMDDVDATHNNNSNNHAAPSNGEAETSFKQSTADFFKPKTAVAASGSGSSSSKAKGKEPAASGPGGELGLDDPLRAGLPW